MPVSLHPRHPAEIAAAQTNAAKRRPSLVLKRGPNPLLIAFPAILTAAAVYVGLVYVHKITNRISEQPAGVEGDANQWFVRDVDTIPMVPPVLEQTPPPSPEFVREEYLRTHRPRTAPAAQSAGVPVLIPELEQSGIPLHAIPLAPMETSDLPAVGFPAANEQQQP